MDLEKKEKDYFGKFRGKNHKITQIFNTVFPKKNKW